MSIGELDLLPVDCTGLESGETDSETSGDVFADALPAMGVTRAGQPEDGRGKVYRVDQNLTAHFVAETEGD